MFCEVKIVAIIFFCSFGRFAMNTFLIYSTR